MEFGKGTYTTHMKERKIVMTYILELSEFQIKFLKCVVWNERFYYKYFKEY